MAIETHDVALQTLDGLRLEGDLAVPSGQVIAGVALCHPHPRFGGDRFNSVVDALFQGLAEAGCLVLRFDFRGVNGSEGMHGDGIDERMDAAAAVDVLATATDAPLWLAGYSFGAAVALDVAHPRIDGWLGIAPPLAMMPGPRIAGTDHRPKHLLVAGHDQFSPPDATAAAVADWRSTTTTVLASADHFLSGHLDQVSAWAVAAVSRG
ncbi:MAG: alpha/beta hydrolase [Ilumatobacteraceae bacterium]